MDQNAQIPLPYAFARKHSVVFLQDQDAPRLAVCGKVSPWALVEARRVLKVPFETVSVEPRAFEQILSDTYMVGDLSQVAMEEDDDSEQLEHLVRGLPQNADLLDSSDDAPIIKLLNGLIAQAVRAKASDIHIEPYEHTISIRERVDGVLREVLSLDAALAPSLVSRIKVMARMDIAEQRVPQDGRITLSIGKRAIDVRVSTLPARFGERVVLRLLDREQASYDLGDLGMSPDLLQSFQSTLLNPNGIVLVTGPTGSGKTTTLYAGLTFLNDRTNNILTVEDPIEYAIEGVGQTQVNPKVGMTFAAGLRAILRQDPNIVMVGEIRDKETAETAVQASLTGHLVLSTVHTNSAISAVTRLRDMGVEPYLLASTLNAILAQRLVRRLCPSCKRPELPTQTECDYLSLRDDQETFHKAKGCSECHFTGYQGRLGIYEYVRMDDNLRELIHANGTENEMAAVAFSAAATLMQSGLAKARAGETSLDEVIRVCRQDGEGHGSL